MVISGENQSASIWAYFEDDNSLELSINGDVPGFEFATANLDDPQVKDFFANVFAGEVKRLSLPLYSRITVGKSDNKWSGIEIDFRPPFGLKRYKPYSSSER